MYRNFASEDQDFIKQMILFKNGQVKDGLKKKVESSIS
ncbi:hypothetical protein SBF1_2280002 [Candidatus Desulfosporosinus infrequens]|uniref:Uncharacterized protein n=1 Tax=Candidatus Desulfosporosinus infrequens TaxID=2043169 RepID=A0A2U3KLY4_9FIRM|nr:hypothetical protein SBF1_2280002 [Candidatus Desulfosporosinus infrequens]